MLALEGRRVSAITIQKILNEREPRHARAALAGPGDARPRGEPIELDGRAGRRSSRSSTRAFKRAPRRERARRASCSRPTPSWSATLEGHRPGLPARRGRHLRLLRASASCTSPSSRRRRWRCCTTTCCRSTEKLELPVRCRAHRQRPRVLRHRAPPLRALPGAQRDRAPHHPGRLSPSTNGFVERFNGTVLAGVLPARHAHGSSTRASRSLQADLDAWLHHYNHDRPHLGYRNQGRRPWDTIELFVRQEDLRGHLIGRNSFDVQP